MIFIIIELIINILELLNCSTAGGEGYRVRRSVEEEIQRSKRTTGEGKNIV